MVSLTEFDFSYHVTVNTQLFMWMCTAYFYHIKPYIINFHPALFENSIPTGKCSLPASKAHLTAKIEWRKMKYK
jgi:hypothetical protein